MALVGKQCIGIVLHAVVGDVWYVRERRIAKEAKKVMT